MTLDHALTRPGNSRAGREPADRRVTLREHLLELRKRLMYSVMAVVVTTGAAFIFTPRIFDLLKRPMGNTPLIYTQVTEMVVVYFNLALTMGIAAATPFILLQAVRFTAPALYPREKRFLYSMLPALLFAFALGAAFAYFVLLPPALKFLINFGADIATPMILISNYVSLVTRLIFWVGVIFEVPIVVFILAKIGLVNARMLVRAWRWAIIGAVIVAGIVTPTPDPVNQALVTVPLIGLYGLSTLMAYLARPGRRKP